MPRDRQRIQKRTPASVVLQISSSKQPFLKELAFTENVGWPGVRVITEGSWEPGERVIVKSYQGSMQSRARVSHGHPLAEARYAVGLELPCPVATGIDVSDRPGVNA